MVTIKGRNLALGCYSLTLDGLAQEAGALLRPLLETIELLFYLRNVQGAMGKAAGGKLPIAGARAAKIGSSFQKLREHLNKYASHVEIGGASIRYLIDAEGGTFRIVQPFNEGVLEQNLATDFLCTAILAREAAICFRHCGRSIAHVSAESLVHKAVRCIEFGTPVVEAIFCEMHCRTRYMVAPLVATLVAQGRPSSTVYRHLLRLRLLLNH